MCSIPGLPTPGSQASVVITRVNLNPAGLVELWVNMDDEDKHEQMRQENHIPKRKFDGMEGKPEDLCLVCVDDLWHRARIVSIHDDSYTLFLIDQAQLLDATSEILAWGESNSFLLPPENESCVLANVLFFNSSWPEKATKFLFSLPKKKFTGLVQHVLMPDRITILDIPVVSMHLCKLGVTKKIPMDEFKCLVQKYLHLPEAVASVGVDIPHEENPNACGSLPKQDQYFYPELLTDTYETVNVTEVTNQLNIFCKLAIFSKAVKILSEQIHQHYEETSDFTEEQPQTCGDPCAARGRDGRWHRSLLKQNIATSNGAVEVLHVDEGKTESVPVGDIRPLLGKFLRMPVITYLCSLAGVNENSREWTASERDYLKSLLLNQSVVVRFDHRMPQDVYEITLYTANAVCVNTCFVEKAGLTPPSNLKQDLNVQNQHILSSLDSMDLQTKGNADVDCSPEETLPSTKNPELNGRTDDTSNSTSTIKASSKDPDPLIHSNGQPSTGFQQDACDDNVLTVGSHVNVKVSCIESLQKFWCQRTENSDSLGRLMQALQSHYASACAQSLVESICVARNPDDDMWYRAKIIANPQSPVVDVRFIDYGQTQKVPLQAVRPIDPVYLQLNALAFQCCLFNPTYRPADTCSDAALTKFQKFVDLGASSETGLKCVVKGVVHDEEGLLLNMVDIEMGSGSVCQLLAQKCAPFEVQEQIPPRVPSDASNYSTNYIEIGGKEKIWVTSSETVSHFYCQLDRNSHLFDKVMKNVVQLGHLRCSDQPLELNSVCIARHTDNQWYRGQVVEMAPKLKVQFLDYGDSLVLSKTDICAIPSEESIARSIPMLAVPLGLSDIPAEVPQEVNQWFADQAIGQAFTISVVGKGEKGKLIVELFDGSLNVNMMVRKRIAQIRKTSLTQDNCSYKMTDLTRQTNQHWPNNSKLATMPNKNCLPEDKKTKMAEQNDVYSSHGIWGRDQLQMSSKSTTNASAPEPEQPTLEVIIEDKHVTQTFIQGFHHDLKLTQPSPPSCSKGNVNVCTYKWPNMSLNKTEEVYATCIVGPHFFWCQYINTEELHTVTELAQKAGQAQKDGIVHEMLEPGSPCLALFSVDNQWYRAQVIQKVDSTLYRVLFVDYGNESEVDMKNVRSLPQGLLEIAPQAFLCSLNGFDESTGSWADEVYDDLYNLLVDKPLNVTIFNMESHSEIAVPQYTVKIESDKVVINSLMQKYWKSSSAEHPKNVMNGRETFPHSSETNGNITQFDVSKGNDNTCMYRKPDISEHKTEMVYASCIKEPNYFWCQYTNTEDLSKVSELAQEAGEAQQDMMFLETLGPGSPCLALFSIDKWHRAQVMHRVDDVVHVVFTDYGNESDIDIKNVRSLPQSLLEIAPLALFCSLNGFDESNGSWADEVYDDFYNLLVDKPLKLTVLSVKNNSMSIVPQYSVKIECEGVIINATMQKYWKPATEESVSTENLLQGVQNESNTTHASASKRNVSTCMYKEPEISKNKMLIVYASCIVEPHYFWCQYTDTEDLSKVSELAQEAGEAQQDMMFLESLGPGSPCLALFSTDNKWHRAQVMHRVDDKVHVVFTDYGNESEVDIKNVRSLPQSLLEIAPLALFCSLNGFDESNGSWADEVYDDFYNLLVDKPLNLTVLSVKNNSMSTVPQYSVKIECEGVIINATMQKYWKPATEKNVSTENLLQEVQNESNTTRASAPKGNMSTCVYKEPDISKNKMLIVYASCIVEPHYFWCQYTDTEDRSKVSELAQEAGEAQQDMMFLETLGPGSPCLALFSTDNKWYRAQVIRRVGDALHVVFIDYGNESEVDIKNVKSLPQSLLGIAPQAFLCRLNGFDESKGSWADEVYDDFYNLLVDKPLKLMVFTMEDHSETTVPQYTVEIECEEVVVNTLMAKYWKELDADAESLQSVKWDESITTGEYVAI